MKTVLVLRRFNSETHNDELMCSKRKGVRALTEDEMKAEIAYLKKQYREEYSKLIEEEIHGKQGTMKH